MSKFTMYYLNPDGSIELAIPGITGFEQDREWINKTQGNKVIFATPSSSTGWKEVVQRYDGMYVGMYVVDVAHADMPPVFAMKVLIGAV